MLLRPLSRSESRGLSDRHMEVDYLPCGAGKKAGGSPCDPLVPRVSQGIRGTFELACSTLHADTKPGSNPWKRHLAAIGHGPERGTILQNQPSSDQAIILAHAAHCILGSWTSGLIGVVARRHVALGQFELHPSGGRTNSGVREVMPSLASSSLVFDCVAERPRVTTVLDCTLMLKSDKIEPSIPCS
ncbi:hypothetical protein BR93DRAFT_302889 [Coniochaeta sp. PMI_546]|nr:hypothetical protein BR93DRAFT_302889 [Coniochaeta sp. PMI_546]